MLSRLRFLAVYLLFWLAFFAGLRAVFLSAFASETAGLPLGTVLGTFGNGLRLDLSASAYLCLVPFLLIALSALPRWTPWASRLILPYTATAIALLTLLAVADLGSFDGWGRHLDASVLAYLTNPREVWASAGIEPRGLLLLLWLSLTILFVGLAWRWLRPPLLSLDPVDPRTAFPLALCAALLLIPGRGGLQLIPVNQSSAYFSPLRFANQAALNPSWNFFDTWRRGLERHRNPYLVMSMDSARALAARARGCLAPADGCGRRESGVLTTARPNILLIVWESFSARAVEPLGGVPGVTPEFTALARDGLLFRRFYAAGDRTEKGLAALLAGAPTIPDASILRFPAKVATLPMLPRDLAKAGYHTRFYYGGELGFGNLQGFTREAGFERVLGEQDFSRASRTSKWGAQDDAVAERLLRDLHGVATPFFITWLTLSSHEPFEVPGPVRIRGNGAEARYLNSLAYTDQVIGNLLRHAAREPWWANTLVIIVADHSRPLEHHDVEAPYKSAESWYHVPMLWTGGALALHGARDGIGSQTDLAPTLLGVLGIPGGERYRFGRDLFAPSGNPAAFYGFEQGFGLVTERGNLVWDRGPGRVTSSSGQPNGADLLLGRAILQLAYQDFLQR